MNYVFHPDAASEHLDSVAFYESRLADLGADYLAVFESAMTIVCQSPLQHPIDSPPDIRVCFMKRFPFSIFFEKPSGVSRYLPLPINGERQNTGQIGWLNQPSLHISRGCVR